MPTEYLGLKPRNEKEIPKIAHRKHIIDVNELPLIFIGDRFQDFVQFLIQKPLGLMDDLFGHRIKYRRHNILVRFECDGICLQRQHFGIFK